VDYANKYLDTGSEVKQGTSPHELAAVVHFSRRVETPAYFDFYEHVRDGEPPYRWRGVTPPLLYVIINRGTFRFHIPRVPPLVRNVFKLPQNKICLRGVYLHSSAENISDRLIDSLGKLRSVDEADPISDTELVCTNQWSNLEERLRPWAEWRNMLKFIRPERDFRWTIHARDRSVVVSEGDQRRHSIRSKLSITRKH
jgi:hypothetical protein